MVRKTPWAWLVVLILAGTGWALARLFDVSTQGGEIYPPYSSLRADPMGAKALHDSLSALPGYRVERSFQPSRRFHPGAQAVVLVLGARNSTQLFEDCQKWVATGVRVVVALDPKTAREAKKSGKPPVPGTLVLAGEATWLSNEGLQKSRDSQRLLTLLGGRRHVIFEESHLGVERSGSIGQLLRRYRLGGAALVLLILSALFFWRNASSLIPEPDSTEELIAHPSGEGALVSLVRGAIPPAAITASALSLWTRGGEVLKSWSTARRDQVARVLKAGGPPLAAWNRAHEILKRKTTT